MDYRQLVRAISTGRVVVGGALVVLPGLAGSRWIGDAARSSEVKVFTRALGVRDLALGLGALQALDGDAPAEPWVTAGLLSDAVDLVATTRALRALGPTRALPGRAMAAGAAAVGYVARSQVD